MIEFFYMHQLDIMLVLSGICASIAFFVLISRNISTRRKLSMLHLELSTMFLLIFDRGTHLFVGDMSHKGYVMFRICNFMVYFLTLAVVHSFNLYLTDLLKNEGNLKKTPMTLRIVEIITGVGELLVIVSQFTGLYYTIDSSNIYHRSPGFIFGCMLPFFAVILDLAVIIKYYRHIRLGVRVSIILFAAIPLVASIIQNFVFGISIISVTFVGMAVLVYFFSYMDFNKSLENANRKELESSKRLFEQTIKALVSAVDAKDKSTRGHSSRVAEYSRKLAEYSGKSEKECEEIYYAALLHDIGKIGIPDCIINKNCSLTDTEYDEIKTHTIIGKQILSSISEFPYLSVGAYYHHERYDGRGYPEKLKGDDIPEIARIIAVADAYDVMTSKRKYSDPVPQEIVREEIIKGSGTQFDPDYAKIMLHLMDIDTDYDMAQKTQVKELAGSNELHPGSFRSEISEGIMINKNYTRIRLRSKRKAVTGKEKSMPALLLFDAIDGRVHTDPQKVKELWYYENGVLWLDGTFECNSARKIKVDVIKKAAGKMPDVVDYEIDAVKFEDHAMIKVSSEYETINFIVALQDCARFLYIGLTGENCDITNVTIDRLDEEIEDGFIPRIAEKITFIDGPEGDVPNLQIDGYHYAFTEGIPLGYTTKLTFHTLSLPTARLIWHCPHIILFYSDDKKVYGKNYREFALIRLDGEHWETDGDAVNKMTVNLDDTFEGWENWKALNKKGYDCEVDFVRDGNTVVTTTRNLGVEVRTVTKVKVDTPEIYVSLTGDQTALTNIRYF